MINGGTSAFRGKRVLLLQGPLGPFFRRLRRDLEKAGARVHKINFNGGDWLFSPFGSTAFRGDVEAWPAFFERILLDQKIDSVLLFGDCRPLHVAARAVAQRCGVEIGVFEEGYVRPDYITFERIGVNGHSQIPRSADFYLGTPETEVPATFPLGNTYWATVTWAILYYLASVILRPLFHQYRHHRSLTLGEALPWVRSTWRKLKYSYKEQGIQKELVAALSNRYFLVPLQVHNDAQVHVHSGYDSVRSFIKNVLISFANSAPPDTFLVIKHHPMDRGYHDYTGFIARIGAKLGVLHRVRYIHDQHLPTLLEHARGVVLINSTVGLSALEHGTPLKVCGAAIYDMEGLTFQGTLDEFWGMAEYESVDRNLYERFRNYVIKHTQLNGNFYKRLDIAKSYTGLIWTASKSHRATTSIPLNAFTDDQQEAALAE